jgi:hypothetical protein
VPMQRKIERCPLCPLQWKSWSIWSIRNYKKKKKKKHPPLCPKIYTLPSPNSNRTNPIHPTRSNLCPNNPAELLHPHKYRKRATKQLNRTVKQRNTRIKKHDERPI